MVCRTASTDSSKQNIVWRPFCFDQEEMDEERLELVRMTYRRFYEVAGKKQYGEHMRQKNKKKLLNTISSCLDRSGQR